MQVQTGQNGNIKERMFVFYSPINISQLVLLPDFQPII